MREFKSISASQLSRFSECRRAWWFQYIMGLPTKQKASAALGESVHTVLERYLDDGVLPDTSTQAGRIAAGVPRL
jgi:RecB family exonuclease